MGQALKTFALDEDVALRAPADLVALLPLDQAVAVGWDGLFLAGDAWTLRSASVDFDAQGVEVGQLVRLSGANGPLASPGQWYLVAGVVGNALSLRRVGQSSGVGQPPAPSSGLANVEFQVVTYVPRLVACSQEIGHRLGLTAADGSLTDPLVDRAVVRDLTVLNLLSRIYKSAATRVEPGVDAYSSIALQFQCEYKDRLAQLAGLSSSRGSGRVIGFQTRLIR